MSEAGYSAGGRLQSQRQPTQSEAAYSVRGRLQCQKQPTESEAAYRRLGGRGWKTRTSRSPESSFSCNLIPLHIVSKSHRHYLTKQQIFRQIPGEFFSKASLYVGLWLREIEATLQKLKLPSFEVFTKPAPEMWVNHLLPVPKRLGAQLNE